jgi:hypothetical protein
VQCASKLATQTCYNKALTCLSNSKFPKFIIVSCNLNIPTPFVLKTIEVLDFKASRFDFCEIWILVMHNVDCNVKFKV